MAPAHFPTDRPNSRQAAPTHLVCNFDKEAESLGGLEEQPGGNVLAEVLGLGAGLHLEGLGMAGVGVGARLALAGPLETLWLCLQLDRAPSHARHPSSCMGVSPWVQSWAQRLRKGQGNSHPGVPRSRPPRPSTWAWLYKHEWWQRPREYRQHREIGSREAGGRGKQIPERGRRKDRLGWKGLESGGV